MKKFSTLLVLLSSLLLIYSSCKDDNDNNLNDNIDYSSKNMQGKYQFCLNCNHFNDSMPYSEISLWEVTDTSFRLHRYLSSQPQISRLKKEGANFHDEYTVYGGILKPYWIKGVIKYIKGSNPYLSDYYYELRGIYCFDVLLMDTIGTFYARQKTRRPTAY